MILFFVFLWLAMMALAIGGFVLWIYVIVEVVRYPDPAWPMSRQDKTTWILVVVLAGWLGAIIYWFVARQPLKDAERQLHASGWQVGYPPPGVGYPTYPPQGYPPQGYPPQGPPGPPPPPPTY